MKTLLWLDDTRNPFEDNNKWLVFSPIERPFQTIWLKNYNEFVEWLMANGTPSAVCFDHDLNSFDDQNKELTGYDCAKFLVDYCLNKKLSLPLYNIQSANPVGKANISCYLENAKKHLPI